MKRASISWRLERPIVLSLFLVAAAYAFEPSEAAACDPVQLCATWTDVVMEDAPFGDLTTGTDYPARGARVRVIRPYPEPALEMFLDDEGCGTFDSQFATGHKVMLYAEAILGLGTSDQIHIKSYPSKQLKDSDTASFFAGDVPSMPEDWNVEVDVPADQNHVIAHLAIATEVIYRLHNLPGSLLTGGHELRIWVDPTAQNASAPMVDDSGNGPETPGGIRVGSAGEAKGVSALGKKFILAHEMGHWIQEEVAGNLLPSHYGYGPVVPPDDMKALDPAASGDPQDAACRWAVETYIADADSTTNPNRHGIRSAEYTDAAMPEGFGHFVASVAFNSDLGEDADGEFHYYKQPGLPVYNDFVADNLVVSLLGGTGASGGDDRWVELLCSDDWAYPEQALTMDEEVTSEIDWLRLFWRFVTESYTPQSAAPKFWNVVYLVTYTQTEHAWNTSDHVVWPKLWQSVHEEMAIYQTRFEDLSADYGVFNDAP